MPKEVPEWPPVTPAEIKELFPQLKLGKSPGSDIISPELLKFNMDRWTAPLAARFTMVDKTGLLPEAWTNAIVVPIYKSHDPLNSSNYRLISVLIIG